MQQLDSGKSPTFFAKSIFAANYNQMDEFKTSTKHLSPCFLEQQSTKWHVPDDQPLHLIHGDMMIYSKIISQP